MKFVIESKPERAAHWQSQLIEADTETAAIDHAARAAAMGASVSLIVRVFRVGEQIATVVNKIEVTR